MCKIANVRLQRTSLIEAALRRIVGRTPGVYEISIAHPLALLGGMEGLGQIKGGHRIIADALYNAIKDNVRHGDLHCRLER